MKSLPGRGVTAAVAATLITAGLLWAADLPRELGIAEPQARQTLLLALDSGDVPVGMAAAALKTVPPPQRGKLVEGALAWAKAYTESPEFAAAYARAREEDKPAAPPPQPPADEVLKQQHAEQRKQIEEMKESVAAMPAEQRKGMEETIRSVTASIEQMQTDPKVLELQKQGIEAEQAQQRQQYEESIRKWRDDYPIDPRPLLAHRLRQFLDASADVDFDAKLVPRDGRLRFADERYEQKPGEWKLCFRAGKEAVSSARSFAAAWLAELEKK